MLEQPPNDLKVWREQVRDAGSIISYLKPCQIHHIAGRTAKQDKLPVGHLLILPLTHWEHTYIDQGKFGLDILKNDFRESNFTEEDLDEMSLHEFEKYLWRRLIHRLPPPPGYENETTAAHNWRRQ